MPGIIRPRTIFRPCRPAIVVVAELGLVLNPYYDLHAIIVAPMTASPPGNDVNPGTVSQPIATPARAQALVRASSLTNTVYFRGGEYNWTARQAVPLILTRADNGQTWSSYPPDGVGSAVLDYTNQSFSGLYSGLGVNGGACCILRGASRITIDGLTFQNCPAIGIVAYGGVSGFGAILPTTNATENPSNIRVRNCIFKNGGYGAFPPLYPNNDGQNVPSPGHGIFSGEVPFVWFTGGASNGQGGGMYGGLVEHCAFLTHAALPVVMQVDNAVAQYNYLQNCNTCAFDSGALYTQLSNGVQFLYNYIRDAKSFKPTQPGVDRAVRALYPDFNSNNFTARGNVVAGAAADTAGYSAPSAFSDQFYFAMFGDGPNANQSYTGNIFDMGATPHVSLLNSSTGSGNKYVGNIHISNFSGNPASLYFGAWYLSYSAGGHGTPSSPTCGPNAYYNYGGGNTYTTGHTNGTPVVSDSNPQLIDPKISGWAYTIDPTSSVFSSPINFPTLPANWGQPGFWGPPSFVIPQIGTGSVPSCSH